MIYQLTMRVVTYRTAPSLVACGFSAGAMKSDIATAIAGVDDETITTSS
jgi:hypothetical protein